MLESSVWPLNMTSDTHNIHVNLNFSIGFLGSSADKESSCNAEDPDLIPGLRRYTGEGIGYPLQYFYLENPHGQRSLAGYRQWGHKESDTAKRLSTAHVCSYRKFPLEKKKKSLKRFSVSSVHSLSCVRLFATPWTTGRQASLSSTNSWSLPKLMSIELVMPSNHLILCRLLLLLPSIFPNIRVFSNESALRIRWPKY